jgi:hypothetical protein
MLDGTSAQPTIEQLRPGDDPVLVSGQPPDRLLPFTCHGL